MLDGCAPAWQPRHSRVAAALDERGSSQPRVHIPHSLSRYRRNRGAGLCGRRRGHSLLIEWDQFVADDQVGDTRGGKSVGVRAWCWTTCRAWLRGSLAVGHPGPRGSTEAPLRDHEEGVRHHDQLRGRLRKAAPRGGQSSDDLAAAAPRVQPCLAGRDPQTMCPRPRSLELLSGAGDRSPGAGDRSPTRHCSAGGLALREFSTSRRRHR